MPWDTKPEDNPCSNCRDQSRGDCYAKPAGTCIHKPRGRRKHADLWRPQYWRCDLCGHRYPYYEHPNAASDATICDLCLPDLLAGLEAMRLAGVHAWHHKVPANTQYPAGIAPHMVCPMTPHIQPAAEFYAEITAAGRGYREQHTNEEGTHATPAD